MSITIDPESEEVTKKDTMTATAKRLVTPVSGKFSSSLNNATGTFSCTAAAIPPAPNISICNAVSPKTVIQIKVIEAGTSRTPKKLTNRTTPRDPRETLAINMPTNGDHAIHHPQ